MDQSQKYCPVQARMTWVNAIPQVLLRRPTGLVVLTGLDTTYNAVHKSIWDAFCNNRRADRVPLNLVVKPTDYEYPRCKPKKTTYEFYIPRGILKTHWLRKTLEEVPSVVVLFWDLDWDDAQWHEKSMECATKVEILRTSLEGRSTRVCVVLIQRNPPLPPGEDVVAAERASSLCSSCNLHAKALFVLPLSDHMLGYAIRLENAFYETSLAYYQSEIRKVKAHKDFLNKTTHQFLYVRHQFKIAFYNEMRQDLHNAIKHYRQAYSHILECRMYDSNMLEIKMISGFITIKICRLLFQLNTPLDSITYFRKHIDFFKTRIGPIGLTFEHSAWMSEMFQVFGELFEEAIRMGLTAVQTQHPGFYFQQAAQMSISRKDQSRSLCKNSVEVMPGMLEQLQHLDYFGQRPWRQGYQCIEAPDSVKEKEGIQTLQAIEGKVDHAALIIPMLNNAVAQFKKYKSPRMKFFLLVQIGEQYLDAKSFSKALKYYNRVLSDYRSERWWLLLQDLLPKAAQCAYMDGSMEDILQLQLESLSPYCGFSKEQRIRIQENVKKILQGESFDPPDGCDPDCVEEAAKLWQKKKEHFIAIAMQKITSCIEVKATFLAETLAVDEPVIIKLFIRSSCPLPIVFSGASLHFSPQVYEEACCTESSSSSGEEAGIILNPEQVKVITFKFMPRMEHLDKELEIKGITLNSASATKPPVEVLLKWPGCKGEALPKTGTVYTYSKTRPQQTVDDATPLQNVETIGIAKLRARDSRLDITITHAPPCLTNEIYALKVLVTNKEASDIHNARFACFIRDGEGVLGLKLTDMTSGTETEPTLDLPSLQQNQQHSIPIYLKTKTENSLRVTVMVTYDANISEGHKCHCKQEESVLVPAVEPFAFTSTLLDFKYGLLGSVTSKEMFFAMVDIACSSPWPIDIATTRFALTESVKLADQDFNSQLEGAQLQCGDCATENQVLCLEHAPLHGQTVDVGEYEIRWKRSNTDLPLVSTLTELPLATWEPLPITLEMDLPALGRCRQPVDVIYRLQNHTVYSQEAEAHMSKSESFLFAGQLKHYLRLLPGSTCTLTYKLVPMFTGKLELPPLQLTLHRYPTLMEHKLRHRIPSHLFVMPSGREAEMKG